jgi:transposase-like protein
MDDQILTLYAKGLTTREIVDAFKEMYDADVSAALISKVTDRVIEQITALQSCHSRSQTYLSVHDR